MKLISGAMAAVLAAVTLAACSSTSSTTVQNTPASPAAPASTVAQALAHGEEASIQQVPWSEVGAGWTLAVWNAANPTKSGGDAAPGEPTPYNSADTLFLVSPEGGRYPITTFTPPAGGYNPVLADWSGDGSRALFYGSGPGSSTNIIEVDLHTGKQTTFNVDHFNITPRYTRPEGKAVLLAKSNDVDSPPSLVRVDLAGNHQLTYPIEQFGSKFGPDVLSTPDGTQLVLGSESGGLAIMNNDGTGIRTLPVPGQRYCTPTRWFDTDSTVAIANCRDYESGISQLWLVPSWGEEPSPLTAPSDGEDSEYLGAETAWRLNDGIFLQAYGPCGYKYLAKIDMAGQKPTKVTVPEVDDHSSVDVIGIYHGKLELQATLSCGSGQSLLYYDPDAGSSTVLLGGPVNGGGVIAALPYPGYD
jgi:hypothetical protein